MINNIDLDNDQPHQYIQQHKPSNPQRNVMDQEQLNLNGKNTFEAGYNLQGKNNSPDNGYPKQNGRSEAYIDVAPDLLPSIGAMRPAMDIGVQGNHGAHADQPENGPTFALNRKPLDREFQSLLFIRKVYGILSSMLFVTAVFVAWGAADQGYRDFLQKNIWLAIISLIVYITSFIALACYRKVARSVPANYIVTFLFTLSSSIVVTYTTILYNPKLILLASAITASMVVGLTLYALFTKTDFTMMGGALSSMMLCLIIGSIFTFFFELP